MAFLGSLDIVGSALSAERFRMDVSLQNLANANNTSPTADGEPYRRQQVVFQERALTFDETLENISGGVQVADVVKSDRDFKSVYDPNNPNADENGYVLYPNVDTTEERLDLMSASTAYEANLTALSVMKAMVNRTLEMNK